MTNFLIGCALGVFFVVCVSIPFLAPWPVRVRLLVNAQFGDPVFGLAPLPAFTMREVTLSSVEADRGHVDLVVDETIAGGLRRNRMSVGGACPAGVVARLDGWSVLHTPLLLIVDDDGRTNIYGPDGSVTSLRPTGEKVK